MANIDQITVGSTTYDIAEKNRVTFTVRSKNSASISVTANAYENVSADLSSDMDPDEYIISVTISGTGSTNLVVRGTSISSRTTVTASVKNIVNTTTNSNGVAFRVVTVKNANWSIA